MMNMIIMRHFVFPRLTVFSTFVLAFSAMGVGASAQESVLPKPQTPFQGKIERTVKDSTPDFPKGVEAPQGTVRPAADARRSVSVITCPRCGAPLIRDRTHSDDRTIPCPQRSTPCRAAHGKRRYRTTNTGVPTLTRPYRSVTSSLYMRMQPYET